MRRTKKENHFDRDTVIFGKNIIVLELRFTSIDETEIYLLIKDNKHCLTINEEVDSSV